VLERYVPGREAGYTRKVVGSGGVITSFYIYFLGPPFNLVLFAVVVAETFTFLPDAQPVPLPFTARVALAAIHHGMARPRGCGWRKCN
jgi:pilus assembly protein TadC